METSLFVPLKGCEFDRFARGEKTIEYRRLGPQYSLKTCRIGRRVTLSHGYSGARLSAIIESVEVFPARKGCGLDTYGSDAIIIAIAMTAITPMAWSPAPRKTESLSASAPSRLDIARAAHSAHPD